MASAADRRDAAAEPRRRRGATRPSAASSFRSCLSRSSSRLGAFLVHNTLVNLDRQHIATGFGFLEREASFDDRRVADRLFARRHLCPRLSGRAAQHALCRGARHRAGDGSRHADRHRAAVAQLARAQAGARLCRDLSQHPAALQLLFWWGLLRAGAPGAAPGLAASAGRFRQQSRRRLSGAASEPGAIYGWCWPLSSASPATVDGQPLGEAAAGRDRHAIPARSGSALGLVVGLPLLVFLAAGAPLALDWPALKGFNFAGGGTDLAGIRGAAVRADRSTPRALSPRSCAPASWR